MIQGGTTCTTIWITRGSMDISRVDSARVIDGDWLAAAQAAYEQSLSLDPHNPTTVELLANLKARRLSSDVPAK